VVVLGMVRTVFTELLSEKFENKGEGENRGTRGAPLGLQQYELRWEIGGPMPMGGIRCTWTVSAIKESKWSFNSLNWCIVKWGVISVLKLKRKEQ
jgi:hypothetical protein